MIEGGQKPVYKNPEAGVICPEQFYAQRMYSFVDRKVQKVLRSSPRGCGLDITPVVAWQSRRAFADFLGSVATLTNVKFEEGLNREISIREDWDRKCRTAYFSIDDLELELSARNERTGLWEIRGRLTDTDLNQLLIIKLVHMFDIPGIEGKPEFSENGFKLATQRTPTLITTVDYLRCNSWPVTNWEDRRTKDGVFSAN